MKFDKRTQLFVLGIVLFVIVGIFLWFRLKSRSTYALPTTATNNDSNDTTFYTAYTACQSTFATTSGVSQNLFGVSTISASGTTVTLKTLVPHGFTSNTKVIVAGVTVASGYNSPVTVSSTLTNSTITYATATGFTVTTASAHNLYVGALVSIQGTGMTTLDSQATTITVGTAPNAVSIPGPLTTYTVVSVPSSTTYTFAAPTGVTTAPTTPGMTVIASGIPTPFSITVTDQFTFTYTVPTAPTGIPSNGYAFDASNAAVMAAYAVKDACLTTAVTTYMTNKCPYTTDPTQVPTSGTALTAYNQYQTDLTTINNAYLVVVQNPGTVSAAQYNAARKADITIATRKYLATVCTGFYAPQSGTDPGTTYQGYTLAPASTNGFDPSQITSANIATWAQYAATDPTVATSSLTTPLTTGSTSWTKANAAGLQNWQVARYAGPGTVPQPTWGTT